MIQPVRSISGFMILSFWWHEYHWRLFPWVLISGFHRHQYIFLKCFCYHRYVFTRLKATSQASHLYWGFPPIIPMNVLGCWLPLAGCTSAFIVLSFFYSCTTAFMTKMSLWFPWWLVSVGGLGVTWTPYDIKNSLILGLKFLKKVALMSNGNTTSWEGA